MKKVQIIGPVVLLLTLLVMAVHMLAVPLPDWVVRTAGVVMLLALAATAYGIARGSMEDK